MSPLLVAGLCAVTLSTGFLSGVFGMAGGLILVGVLLALMPLPTALALHAMTQPEFWLRRTSRYGECPGFGGGVQATVDSNSSSRSGSIENEESASGASLSGSLGPRISR